MDQIIEALVLTATGWATATGGTPILNALVGLALVGGVALAFSVTGGPRPDADMLAAPTLQPALAGPSWTDRLDNTGERPEASPVAVYPRTEARAAAPPPPNPLSQTDRIALAWLRDRIRAGEVAEGPTQAQRLAFARYLAQHGRLGD
jgi:hypothetical protein